MNSKLKKRRLEVMLQKLGELQYEYMEGLEAQVIGGAENLEQLNAITQQYVLIKREREPAKEKSS